MAPATAELAMRTLFFAAIITALVFMPWEFKVAATIAALLRYFIVMFVVVRNCRRVGEGGLATRHFIYDLIEPLLRLAIALTSKKRTKKSWL